MKRRLLLLLPIAIAACTASNDESDSTSSEKIAVDGRLFQVRITTNNPEATSRKLADDGFDVLEGSEEATSLDVIGTNADIIKLRRLGFDPQPISMGAPLKETQLDIGYPSLREMLEQMHQIEVAYPNLAKVVDLTEKYNLPATVEGRHMYAMKISANVAVDEDEPAYLVVSNHHARELGPPVVAMNTMNQLTSTYATNATVKGILDSSEIWIAPTWNPDGLEYVHTTNNMWRKNRRPPATGTAVGVDLNRNYPHLWQTNCGNSTSLSSETYKGPAAGSEIETQTMMALSNDRRFAKVLDFHSSGREVLVNYSCATHPLASHFNGIGTELSRQMGYGGHVRRPSGHGEHQDWQLANLGSLAFLVEINTSFQPPFASAKAEAEQLYPGILWYFQRPTPISGHIPDATTGKPIVASITIRPVAFANGEKNSSGGAFGRYQANVPAGTYTIEVAAPGYVTQTIEAAVTGETRLDVSLTPAS